jgi:hypothetical protein
MTLSPFALNVIMALIGIAIPALVYVGCIMTRKKKDVPVVHETVPHVELDRAA